jgi:hypothetical protein
MRIATAQLPEPPHGADRVVVAGDAVVVLDGASAIEPVSVPPGTYADSLGVSVSAALAADPGAPLAGVLAAAIEAAVGELGLAGDACPSSTVVMLRVTGGQVDLLALGDSYIFYDAGPDGTGVLTDDRQAALRLPQRREYRQRLAAGNGYDAAHRDLLRALQREQRKHRNRLGGYWIAEADPAAARHARTLTLPLSAMSWAVLATDGAVNTARHLGLDDWPELARFDSGALARFLERCEQWEESADPAGRLFPRAKRHDDKTIASVILR